MKRIDASLQPRQDAAAGTVNRGYAQAEVGGHVLGRLVKYGGAPKGLPGNVRDVPPNLCTRQGEKSLLPFGIPRRLFGGRLVLFQELLGVSAATALKPTLLGRMPVA